MWGPGAEEKGLTKPKALECTLLWTNDFLRIYCDCVPYRSSTVLAFYQLLKKTRVEMIIIHHHSFDFASFLRESKKKPKLSLFALSSVDFRKPKTPVPTTACHGAAAMQQLLPLNSNWHAEMHCVAEICPIA